MGKLGLAMLCLAMVADAQVSVRDFLGLGPAPDAKAASLGEPIYKENCAACHGATARGAQGPNLVRSPLVLHDEKGEEIKGVVRAGRQGMPAFPSLSDEQIYDVAEYIHLQIELAANRGTYKETYNNSRNRVSGDAENGRRFFESNCTGCHSASGDLAKVGAKYPMASVMLNRIAWPVSNGPRQATVTSGDGVQVTGTVVTLNDFEVAVRDSNGVYHSWPRGAVKVDVVDKLAGHRALLPKYTDENLHDLTAYLVTLK